MYGTSDISHTFGELQWGGPPHEHREWYAAHSPSSFAHEDAPDDSFVLGWVLADQEYTRGAVGMGLSGPDTGGSQFFVTHSPQPHLDGGYTIFGRVYAGMSGVVDHTERGDRVEKITIDEHAPPTKGELTSSSAAPASAAKP